MHYLNISKTVLFCLVVVLCTASFCTPDVEYKRKGNSVVVRMESDPDNLNTVLTQTQYGRIPTELAHMGLMSFDEDTYELTPWLIKNKPEAVDLPNNAVSYTFEILDEAKWDDGKPVTGHDYAFAVKTILNPKIESVVRPFVEEIKEINVDPKNPKRFTVVMSPKTIYSLEYATNSFNLLPTHLLDPKGLMKGFSIAELADTNKLEALMANPKIAAFAELFNSPAYSNDPKFLVGCGPYLIESWTPGEKVVVKKKKDWWGNALAKTNDFFVANPDEIVFKIIPDPAAATAALKNEEIDATNKLAPEDFIELQKNENVSSRYNFLNPSTMTYFCIPVNMRVPKLADKKVRQAIAHLIDVDEAIEELYYGFGERTCSPVPLNSPDYNKNLKPIPYDPAKAKQLLTEAGWKDSNGNGIVDKVIDGKLTEMSLSYLYAAGRETSEQLALIIQDNAKKVGIEIKPQALEGREVIGRWATHDYELLSAGRGLSPIWAPEQTWRTDGDNRSGFGNAETDALIDQIPITFDAKKRRELYYRLQEIIFDEQAEIFLFSLKECVAVHKRFIAEPIGSSPGYSPADFKLK